MRSNATPVRVGRIVLHIGTEKTGTSSVQKFLAKNRTALAAEGVVYPRFTGTDDGSQWGFVAAVQPRPWQTEIGARLGIWGEAEANAYRQRLLEAIDTELRACPSRHTMILSSEHFHSRLITPAMLRALKSLLGRWSDSVEVVVYFRRQDRVAVSLYSTRLKVGQTEPCVFPVVSDEPLPYYYDYERIYANWSQVFGKQAVQVGIFAPDYLVGGDLLTDFCGRAGVAVKGKKWPAKINESLSDVGVQLVLELNRQWPNKPAKGVNLSRELLAARIARENPGRSFPASRSQAQAFYAHFVAGNARLAKAVFPPMEGALFDENFSDYPDVLPLRSTDLSQRVYKRAKVWRAAAAIEQKIGLGPRLLSVRHALDGATARLKSFVARVGRRYL